MIQYGRKVLWGNHPIGAFLALMLFIRIGPFRVRSSESTVLLIETLEDKYIIEETSESFFLVRKLRGYLNRYDFANAIEIPK